MILYGWEPLDENYHWRPWLRTIELDENYLKKNKPKHCIQRMCWKVILNYETSVECFFQKYNKNAMKIFNTSNIWKNICYISYHVTEHRDPQTIWTWYKMKITSYAVTLVYQNKIQMIAQELSINVTIWRNIYWIFVRLPSQGVFKYLYL